MKSALVLLPHARGPVPAGAAHPPAAPSHGVGSARIIPGRARGLVALVALLSAGVAPPSFAALDYPVIVPGNDPIVAPAYRGDEIEIQLAPRAAAQARLLRTAYAEDATVPRIGVPALDGLATALGVRAYEPLFRNETPPAPGTAGPDFTAFYLVHLAPGIDLEDALSRLRALPDVVTADPVAILPVSRTPNDSLFSVSTWFHDIHAPEAWDITTGDSSIVVAILDTGVIPYHPDLGGTTPGYAGNIWTNTAEANGLPGVDDDGDGYVDDVHGWDFVNTSPIGVPPAEDALDEDPDPNDYAGHGTAVAGLAAALSDNGIGGAGTAWGVRIMPVRVGFALTTDTLGAVEMPFVERGLRYAARKGANIINCSFATLDQAGLLAAAGAAVASGALIVCAAGNNSQPHDLANREDVLAVAATDPNDKIPSYSNRGSYVDLAAPGGPVYSTFVTRVSADSVGRRQPAYFTIGTLTGTSFSAPLATGAAALMQSLRRQHGEPLLTPYDLIQRLFETTDDIGPDNPGVTGYGSGRLNVFRALTEGISAGFRVEGRTVGAGAVLYLANGTRRQVYALDSGRLVFVDGREQVSNSVMLPGTPVGDPACADLGMGLGPAVFVAVSGGKLASYDALGAPRAGWPVSVVAGFVTGPALADLDGDGRLEVVACSGDGGVWAWRPDGTVVSGFPHSIGSAATAGAALADLDGVPGAEIVVSNGVEVFALGADGNPVAGWPRLIPGVQLGPVVMRAPGGEPRIILLAGTQLMSYSGAGVLRHDVALQAEPVQAPALGDVDGDGVDDLVLETRSPSTVTALDTLGAPLSGLGWPVALTVESSGPPLVAQARERDAGARPEVLAVDGSRLLAFTNDARPLRTFPRPGGAGYRSSVAQLDDGGAVQVLAGTSALDSVLYVLDAGPQSATGEASPWFTARGTFARTGSRIDPPGPPYGLRRAAASETTLTLAWVAPGDDAGSQGRPALYRVRMATDAAFASYRDTIVTAAQPPGAEEQVAFSGLTADTMYWFTVRASGTWGIQSLESGPLETSTLGVPIPGGGGLSLAPRARPSRLPVEFVWSVPGEVRGTRIVVYDLTGRRLVTLGLSGVGGTLQWDGRDAHGARVPAGLYFARLISGSLHTQTRVVLLP